MHLLEEIKLEDHERQLTEVWTRCMGYHRPVSDFNIGKKQEFKERVPFKTDKVLNQDELDK